MLPPLRLYLAADGSVAEQTAQGFAELYGMALDVEIDDFALHAAGFVALDVLDPGVLQIRLDARKYDDMMHRALVPFLTSDGFRHFIVYFYHHGWKREVIEGGAAVVARLEQLVDTFESTTKAVPIAVQHLDEADADPRLREFAATVAGRIFDRQLHVELRWKGFADNMIAIDADRGTYAYIGSAFDVDLGAGFSRQFLGRSADDGLPNQTYARAIVDMNRFMAGYSDITLMRYEALNVRSPHGPTRRLSSQRCVALTKDSVTERDVYLVLSLPHQDTGMDLHRPHRSADFFL